MEIPQQYLDVLSRINGIEFNGFILYGVDQYLLEHEMKSASLWVIGIQSHMA